MKYSIILLETASARIADRIDARVSYYDNRTDAWHKSEKAEIHDKKTDRLRDAVFTIGDAINELNYFNEA